MMVLPPTSVKHAVAVPTGTAKLTDPFSIFFLQRLHEALFDYSADSFKAPALNTHLRVVELKRIGAQAESHDFLSASVESFFDELEWSVTHDPVLRGTKKELVRELLTRAKASWGKAAQFLPAVSALEVQFNDYLKELKAALVEQAESTNWSKKAVVQLLDSLIVELELVGFPRGNIYAVAQKINGRKKKRRLQTGPKHTVELFLKHFGTARRKYNASVFVCERLAEVVARFPGWKHETALPESHEKLYGWKEYAASNDTAQTPTLISYDCATLCSQSASRTAFNALDRIREQVAFIDHHLHLPVHDKIYCLETTLNIATICPRPLSPLRFVPKTSGEELGDALEVFRHFFSEGSLTAPTRRRLSRALEYHGAALRADRPEDQLLNLWSCLEGFVGVPSTAGSKIAFVRESVLSCLSLLYPQRLFALTSNRIGEVIGTDMYAGFLRNAATHTTSFYEQLALVLVCPAFESDRSALAAAIAQREPVLLFRLFELLGRFKDPQVTKETLVKHRAKVAWQVNRIYWNRNLIVHSAESLPYLSTLVEHLHVYVDSFLSSILYVAAGERATTIPTVLELISVHESHRLRDLGGTKGAKDQSPATVLDWTFGGANILRKNSGL